jgi:hypothetical protein
MARPRPKTDEFRSWGSPIRQQPLIVGPETYKPTRDEVMALRTVEGGWTAAQLAKWGVSWPPSKGWIERLTS